MKFQVYIYVFASHKYYLAILQAIERISIKMSLCTMFNNKGAPFIYAYHCIGRAMAKYQNAILKL